MIHWLKEELIAFAICTVIIFIRIFARTKIVGFRGWKGDDWMILIVLINFAISVAGVYGVAKHGTNLTVTNEIAAKLKPEKIKQLEIGSQWNLVAWIGYVNTVWALKACMLFLLQRVTLGLVQQRMVYITFMLVALTFIATTLTVLLHCRPFHTHWQVKPRPKCTPHFENFYVMGITNFLTDGIIIAIPAPLILRSTMPIRRKILIGILLCSGIFIMFATAIRCISSLVEIYHHHERNLGNVIPWATREALVAIIVVNAPCIKPLFGSAYEKKVEPCIEALSPASVDSATSSKNSVIERRPTDTNAAYGYVSVVMSERSNVESTRSSSDIPEFTSTPLSARPNQREET